jgi:hypothetical protein
VRDHGKSFRITVLDHLVFSQKGVFCMFRENTYNTDLADLLIESAQTLMDDAIMRYCYQSL